MIYLRLGVLLYYLAILIKFVIHFSLVLLLLSHLLFILSFMFYLQFDILPVCLVNCSAFQISHFFYVSHIMLQLRNTRGPYQVLSFSLFLFNQCRSHHSSIYVYLFVVTREFSVPKPMDHVLELLLKNQFKCLLKIMVSDCTLNLNFWIVLRHYKLHSHMVLFTP